MHTTRYYIYAALPHGGATAGRPTTAAAATTLLWAPSPAPPSYARAEWLLPAPASPPARMAAQLVVVLLRGGLIVHDVR